MICQLQIRQTPQTATSTSLKDPVGAMPWTGAEELRNFRETVGDPLREIWSTKVPRLSFLLFLHILSGEAPPPRCKNSQNHKHHLRPGGIDPTVESSGKSMGLVPSCIKYWSLNNSMWVFASVWVVELIHSFADDKLLCELEAWGGSYRLCRSQP